MYSSTPQHNTETTDAESAKSNSGPTLCKSAIYKAMCLIEKQAACRNKNEHSTQSAIGWETLTWTIYDCKPQMTNGIAWCRFWFTQWNKPQ